MGKQPRQPEGLVYRPELITPAEERQVLGVLKAMELRTITMHGQTARRTVRHFGLDYGYESWKLVPTDPFPGELHWLQERSASLAGLDPGQFAQFLVTRYPPGGDHRLAPRRPHVRPRGGRGVTGRGLPDALPARQGTASPRAAHPGRPGHFQGSPGWWVSTITGVWKGGLSPHQPFGGILGPGAGPAALLPAPGLELEHPLVQLHAADASALSSSSDPCASSGLTARTSRPAATYSQ
jgi:hypothetical protein